MAGLTAPPLGTYTVLPPTADEINDYLRMMRVYNEAKANGFEDENNRPALYATINGERSHVGIIQNGDDKLLLCSYVLPWMGSDDDKQLGRLYFALIGEHANPESHEPPIVTWKSHPGLLVTATDGDANIMTPLALSKTLVQLLGG